MKNTGPLLLYSYPLIVNGQWYCLAFRNEKDFRRSENFKIKEVHISEFSKIVISGWWHLAIKQEKKKMEYSETSLFKLVETEIIIQMVRVINKMNMEGQSEDTILGECISPVFSLWKEHYEFWRHIDWNLHLILFCL